jgi:6-phosphogluconolactonase/Glucosamine-6-phosphate isomerase/deaminase
LDVTIFETATEASRALARRVADTLRRTPDLVLGLPAGRTPVETYTELGRLHSAGEADFSHATAFLLDEFVGLDESHAGSFRRFLTEHLLSGINLSPNQTHSLNGVAPDPDGECERYEETIAAVGGLDLLLLGLGVNGHIGFNEPGQTLAARTHRVTLLDSTRAENAGPFGGAALVPTEALSIGIGTILRADTIVIIATGARKASAVAGMLRGPVTTTLPASFLQLHRRVEAYLDRAAAAAL